MAVLNPLKLVITNFEGEEEIELDDYPQLENSTKRKYYFGKELLIEKEDFLKEPIPKFHRLYPGAMVRLKGAYIIKCTGFDEDENGNVTCVYAEYDPATKSGSDCTVKVKGTIHFINPKHALECEARLFENLVDEQSASEVEGQENEVSSGYIPIVAHPERYQFIRNGYFCLDKDSTDKKLVFNRTITLKETKKV